jgi:hypothetical protein
MAAMTMAAAELPDDVDALKAMIVAMAEQRALLEARTSHLEVVNKTADERIATLTAIVRMLERSRYGTRSERLRGATLSDEQHAFVFGTSRSVRHVPAKASLLIWSGLRLSLNLRFRQAVMGWRRFRSARTCPSVWTWCGQGSG